MFFILIVFYILEKGNKIIKNKNWFNSVIFLLFSILFLIVM